MSTPLSVGVIGCGGIAQMMHLPTLAERPDLFRIAALADVNPVTLEAVARRYGISAVTTDFRQLCTRPDVDAVLLAASGSHKDAAIAALDAGKHLFSEKPLGYGLAELDAIAAAAKKSRGRVMIGYHKRFDPAYVHAKSAAREIQDLRFVQVTVLHPDDNVYRAHHAILPVRPFVEPPEEISNRQTVEMIAGAPFKSLLDDICGREAPIAQRVAALILYESLIHDLNALRGILGEPEEVLSAHCWNEGFAQTSVTRFAGTVRANLSWVSLPGLRHYEETVLFAGPKSRVKLVFPSPYLRHEPTPLIIQRMDGDTLVEEQRIVSYEEAFRAELHTFRRCVQEELPPPSSIEDAYRDTLWIQAIAAAFRGAPGPIGGLGAR